MDVFTWQQALTRFTPAQARSAVARGEWVREFRGVFRPAALPSTPELRIRAAALSTGSAVAGSHDTAAQVHGFDVLGDRRTHVICAAPRTTRASGLVVHRDRVADADLIRTRGVLVTTAVRTAADLARTYNRLDALALLDRALPHTCVAELSEELDRHRGKRGVRQAHELLGYVDGRAESPQESRTRMRCIDAGLPTPQPQVVVRAGGRERRIDLGWPAHKIGLEYESGEFHSGAAAASRDNPRHNWLLDQGWRMFYATAAQVYRHPEQFTEPIRKALSA